MSAAGLYVVSYTGTKLLEREVVGVKAASSASQIAWGVEQTGSNNTDGIKVQAFGSEDAQVALATFHDNLTIIGLTSEQVPQKDMQRWLHCAYDILVVYLGLNTLKSGAQIDQLTNRDVKVVVPAMDVLLGLSGSVGSKLRRLDTVLLEEGEVALLKQSMGAFDTGLAECRESVAHVEAREGNAPFAVYACVMIHGRLAYGSASWFELHEDDRFAIQTVLASQPGEFARDLPLFLPQMSATQRVRLVTVCITPGMELVMVAGGNPDLNVIVREAGRAFSRVAAGSMSSNGLFSLSDKLQANKWNSEHSFWSLGKNLRAQVDSGIAALLVEDLAGHAIVSYCTTLAKRIKYTLNKVSREYMEEDGSDKDNNTADVGRGSSSSSSSSSSVAGVGAAGSSKSRVVEEDGAANVAVDVMAVLLEFYQQSQLFYDADDLLEGTSHEESTRGVEVNDEPLDSYIQLKNYGLCSVTRDGRRVYALLDVDVPVFAMVPLIEDLLGESDLVAAMERVRGV